MREKGDGKKRTSYKAMEGDAVEYFRMRRGTGKEVALKQRKHCSNIRRNIESTGENLVDEGITIEPSRKER